jgi:hypothetical protein
LALPTTSNPAPNSPALIAEAVAYWWKWTTVVFAFPAKLVQGLKQATPEELVDIELLGCGYALHWSRVNADIRIESVLAGVFGSKKMMRLAAKKTGERTSEKKAFAARTNGTKGGRPRKLAA